MMSVPPARSAPWPLRPRFLAAAGLLASVAALVLLRLRAPTNVALIPECPTHSVLGVYCPGCGSLRATHHALHGRLGDAIAHNPVLLAIGVPAALAMGAILVVALVRGRWPALPALPGWLAALLAILVIGFGVLRNVPLAALDLLRPPALGGAAVEGHPGPPDPASASSLS